MKKFYSLVCILMALFAVQSANAQTRFNASLKATPQFSWMLNKEDNQLDDFDRKATINTNFGIGLGYMFSLKTGLSLDVLYSLQGQKYNLAGMELDQKMNYIKLPLTFEYNFNPLSKVSVIGKLGPQVSILTGSKVTDYNGKTIVRDSKEYFDDITWGAVAGLTAQYNLGSNWAFITGLRYDYDLSNAENTKHEDYETGREATHNMTAGLEVGIKYFFNLKK